MKQFRTLIDALYSAPPDRPFITYWVDEDEQETVTFGEFRSARAVGKPCFCAATV